MSKKDIDKNEPIGNIDGEIDSLKAAAEANDASSDTAPEDVAIGQIENSAEDKAAEDEAAEVEKSIEEMTELVADKDDTKYSDDEIEEMDVKRMAHVIMNDENRTNMDILDEVMEDDAYTLKQKRKEAKLAAKLEKRGASGETKGIRFLGIMSIIMALAGVALILVTIYYLAIAPTYNKNEYLSHQLSYPDSATLTDADYTQVKEGYYVPEIATSDAQPEVATSDAQPEQGGEELE